MPTSSVGPARRLRLAAASLAAVVFGVLGVLVFTRLPEALTLGAPPTGLVLRFIAASYVIAFALALFLAARAVLIVATRSSKSSDDDDRIWPPLGCVAILAALAPLTALLVVPLAIYLAIVAVISLAHRIRLLLRPMAFWRRAPLGPALDPSRRDTGPGTRERALRALGEEARAQLVGLDATSLAAATSVWKHAYDECESARSSLIGRSQALVGFTGVVGGLSAISAAGLASAQLPPLLAAGIAAVGI